ncbi:MAG TPA: transaldolase [Actinobacteria bacterium]|nr:transaldolase [Actinomycetota bacterium]
MNPLQELHEAGVSIWLDTIRRNLVATDQFARMIADDAVTGVTSNPSIFEKAIGGSTDYDTPVRELLETGEEDPRALFFTMGLQDIRLAADALRGAFDASDGREGFGSFEVLPELAHDTAGTVSQGRDLWARLDRPNVMIKVPGTDAGIPAIEELTAAGVNVNVTLLFSLDNYERAALAYIAGLERRVDAGEPVHGMASVASFFVSRVDTAVDRQLAKDSPLRGKVAVANARLAYARFRELFSGPRWERLAAAGARVQRPLWASTGTKDPAYSDVLYVEELIAPDTVNTMPEATLLAFKDHGRVVQTIEPNLDDARRVVAKAANAGVDLAAVTAQLLVEGLEAFTEAFDKLIAVIEDKVQAVREERTGHASWLPGGLDEAVSARLASMDGEEATRRIWAHDHTVWSSSPTEITDRLGWLTVHDLMHERVPELKEFAAQVAADGLTDVVLAGMGGSSLAPEVLRETFGVAPGALELHVLDTTNPDQIIAVERSLDLDKTLFVIASKSGGTTETLSHFAYFWEKVPRGSNYVAITDPGTSLEQLAKDHDFREVFVNPPDIGGRYSALSYFGLVHGALIGMDLDGLLDRAIQAEHACASCVPAAENPGAWLGAVMGEAALAGRDKLTLVLPESIRSFGYWVEQLIAESTGKEGRGILPVEGEDVGSPDVYGSDRLFVGVGGDEIRDLLLPLEHAGHPAALLPFGDLVELGSQFFTWEFAVAVAGMVLGIQPFDQPNVQEAKDATKELLAAGDVRPPGYDALEPLLKEVKPGDYLAIQAYIPRNGETEARLHAARMRLRDRLRVATTVGFGPRFLHSTGQFHKGGPNSGVFVQVVDEPAEDLAIPGQPYTFGTLLAAQSLGDLQSLRSHGRRVARVHLADLEAAAEGGS